MSESLVLCDIDLSGYALVTLNRPQAMNALSRALICELTQTLDRLCANDAVRVLILTGKGRAFCSGIDLKELGAGSLAATGGEPTLDPVAALDRFAGPIIGAINGAAVTGGFELALACDVLLASTEARFADTHVRVGIAPGWGLSQKLSRAIGMYRAREMSFSGNWVSAEQAATWGFVNRVVTPDQLLPQAIALAKDMLTTVPESLEHYKALMRDGFALAFGEAMQLEQQRARAWLREVNPAEIESRRETLLQHNRG